MSDGEVFQSENVSAQALASVAFYIDHAGMSGWTGSAIVEELKRRAGRKRAKEAERAALVEVGRLVINTIDDPYGPAESETDQAIRVGAAALRVIGEQSAGLGIEVVTIASRPFGYEDVTAAYSQPEHIDALRMKLSGGAS